MSACAERQSSRNESRQPPPELVRRSCGHGRPVTNAEPRAVQRRRIGAPERIPGHSRVMPTMCTLVDFMQGLTGAAEK